jgi:hypothetical protein
MDWMAWMSISGDFNPTAGRLAGGGAHANALAVRILCHPHFTFDFVGNGRLRTMRTWISESARRPRRALRLRRALAGVASLLLLFLSPRPAQAATQTLQAALSGAQEVPADSSHAQGSCTASVDTASGLVTFSGTFSGLRTPATGAAIHGLALSGATAGVLVPQTALTSAVSGTFSGSGSLQPIQVAGLLAGQAYCEIDDGAFPSGEIRGQLTTASPAPALPPAGLGFLVVLLGGVGLAALRRRARGSQA